jgi:hypothetical protein
MTIILSSTAPWDKLEDFKDAKLPNEEDVRVALESYFNRDHENFSVINNGDLYV